MQECLQQNNVHDLFIRVLATRFSCLQLRAIFLSLITLACLVMDITSQQQKTSETL